MSALLEFKKISKAFGSVQANRAVSFSVSRQTIHALVGENGAGKSTIMKILFGLYTPDQGEIVIDGKEQIISSPIDSKNLGIGMVHQHFMLAGKMTALDHLILDQKDIQQSNNGNFFANFARSLPRNRILEKAKEISANYGMPVPWTETIENLSVGIQQRVEILKLLFNNSEILILDEPTAVLTPQEVIELFEQLKNLKASGKTIIIITHKLKEVLAIADNVTVLRQGELVYSGAVKGHTIDSLGELMIGRKIHQPKKELAKSHHLPPLLEIKNLSYSDGEIKKLDEISLHVFPGEIVGIAGVEGNGQTELLNCIMRPQFLTGHIHGEIKALGQSLFKLKSHEIRNLGLSYFAEDRLHQALLTDQSSQENFLLGQQWSPQFQKLGWINKAKLHQATQQAFKDFDVRPQNLDLEMGRFSGGNQQKFVVARELFKNPKLLIAAQPTRGVDIGAIELIHHEMLKLRSEAEHSKNGILLVSSELDEVLKLSDRIYVIFKGKIVAEYSKPPFDEMEIGAFMGGKIS